MKRPIPWNDQVDVILSDESGSDADDDESASQQTSNEATIDEPAKERSPKGIQIIFHLISSWLLNCFCNLHFQCNILELLR